MSTIIFDFRHYYRKGERRESDQIAYQWDLGHVAEIYVPVNATYEIHYCFADFTETDDYAVESITAAEDGGYKLTAHIPNELFERSGELKVYVIGADDNHVLTTYEGYITIRGRTKPEDYVDDDPENEATRILTGAREARDAAIEAAEQAEAAASQSAAQASIAEVYDATKTYAIGDYCLYDGQLYECTAEITTPEAWTAAHWTAATVGAELNDIQDDVSGLKEDLSKESNNLYNTVFELGSLNGSTGAETSSTTVIRSGYVALEANTTYIMYNLRDKYINLINPAQYIYEYDSNKNFLRQSAVYIATFTTGENTAYIRFLSNSYASMSSYLSDINSQKFQINKGSLLWKYEIADRKTKFNEKFSGVESENLYTGYFDIEGLISNGAWNWWGNYVAVITYPVTVSGTNLYFLVDNSVNAFGLTYAYCYKADGTYLSSVTASVSFVATGTRIMHAVLPANTKYVYLSTPSYTRTSSDRATIISMITDHLIITEDFDYAFNRIATGSENKVNASLVKYGFHTDILNTDMRDFIVSALHTYVDGINASGYDAVIPIMTDIHTLWHEPYAILNWMSRCGVADIVANLGDNIPNSFTTQAEALEFLGKIFSISNAVPMCSPIINIQGNHDTNPVNSTISDGSNMIKNNVYYALSRERTIKGFVSGTNYGYVDIENAKIRVIFLDTSDIYDSDGTPLIGGNNTLIQQTQLTWLYSVALDFSDKTDASEWAVVTMAHERLSTLASNDIFGQLFEAFSDGTTLSASGTKTVDGYTETLTVDVDFTSQGAIPYICHINGHYHNDTVVTFGDSFNQISIACECGTAYDSTQTAYTRTMETVDEHLMDTFCIDKTNRKIYMKRFGVGSDRTFSY